MCFLMNTVLLAPSVHLHIHPLSRLSLLLSLMKISASSLNVLTWTKALETSCLKEKHLLYQNLNQTQTVIRNEKMKGKEVRHMAGDSGKDEFQLWMPLACFSKSRHRLSDYEE